MGYPLDTPKISEGYAMSGYSRGKSLEGLQGERRQSYSHGDRSRERRRHKPWLRVLLALFIAVELMITILVGELAPVYDFYLTSTVTVDGSTEIARNPDLTYPIKLGGGTLCQPYELDECLVDNPPSNVCCTELLSSSSSGPEELITTIMMFGYCVVIPGLILLMRGFLLGRVWAMSPCSSFLDQDDSRVPTAAGNRAEEARGKERWHLRVGFYSLDTCLGLVASIVTTLMFTAILKVATGRPRPNYWALRIFTENALNGDERQNPLFGRYPQQPDVDVMEVMDEIGTWMGAIPIMGSFQRAKYRRGFFVCDYSSILDLPNRGMTYMDFSETMKRGWPSGHSSVSAAGLLFLAHVLWADLMALVQWRQQEHPRITLLMAMLGGFVMMGLPLCSILIGVSRIRDYWHRPDEVLAGLALGVVCAHWCFRFVVLVPFNLEIGTLEEEGRHRNDGQNESQWAGPGGRGRRPDRAANDNASTPSTKYVEPTMEQQQQQPVTPMRDILQAI